MISPNSFAYFLEFCKQTRPDCIHITGGEPSLHPTFSEMIGQLSDIAPLVIYSNLTVPECFSQISVKDPKDIFILANFNGKDFYTGSQWNTFRENMRNARDTGFKIALALTVYQIPLEDRFKEALEQIRENRITHFRISQAVENSSKQQGLDRTGIQKLYAFVAEHISEWKAEGIKAYFDCPVPPCYMDMETFRVLQRQVTMPWG